MRALCVACGLWFVVALLEKESGDNSLPQLTADHTWSSSRRRGEEVERGR
eukprot:m.16510 g.16510  ORF g.16510 m.16510 type:complete len:50 (-) comp5265_c0_seq2:1116-1265(-)